jgi:hypothetical protein
MLNFKDAKFKNNVTFTNITFKELRAWDSIFYYKVDFRNSTFKGQADFLSAIFTGETFFIDVKFLGKTNFDDAIFSGYTKFEFTEFAEVSFKNTIFIQLEFNVYCSDEIDFYKTEFLGFTDFRHSIFSTRTYFNDINFNNDLSSDTSKIIAQVEDKEIKKKIENVLNEIEKEKRFTFFRNVIFESPEKILFHTNDLTNVSFLNTDIKRINFSETSYFDKENNYMILEERELKKENERNKKENDNNLGKNNHILKDVNLESIVAVYRNLRENYEYNLRYDEAGIFFIREMELKRKYVRSHTSEIKLKNGIKRNFFSLIALYYLIANYGESLKRPFLFIVVILSVGTMFWILLPNINTSIPFTIELNGYNVSIPFTIELNGIQNITDYNYDMKALERSISGIIPFLTPSEEKPVLTDFVFKLLGVLTFGILFISLRRKFERRFRH